MDFDLQARDGAGLVVPEESHHHYGQHLCIAHAGQLMARVPYSLSGK